jgi:hypothetical protein
MITSSPMCPKCGAPLKPAQILAAGPFRCPNCDAKLQASDSYGRWIALGSLVLSVVVPLVFGIRGLHFLYAVLLLLVVIVYLAVHLLKYAIPPKIGVSVPKTPLRQLVREIMGPTELNLRDKNRPQARNHDVKENSDGLKG